jgi:hypothetical protein
VAMARPNPASAPLPQATARTAPRAGHSPAREPAPPQARAPAPPTIDGAASRRLGERWRAPDAAVRPEAGAASLPTALRGTGDRDATTAPSSSTSSSSSTGSSSDDSSSSCSSSDSDAGRIRHKKPRQSPRQISNRSSQNSEVLLSEPLLPRQERRNSPPPQTPYASTTRKRAPPQTQTIPSKGLEDAPTSLSRLWPDPSDVIRAITRWQPPIAVARPNSSGRDAVEFHGPIQCHRPESGKTDNPLLQSARSGGALPTQFENTDAIMETLAQPLMEEGLCSLNKDYDSDKYGNGRWNRESYLLRWVVVLVNSRHVCVGAWL